MGCAFFDLLVCDIFVIFWGWCREIRRLQTGGLRILLIWWAAQFCDLVVCVFVVCDLVQGERVAADRWAAHFLILRFVIRCRERGQCQTGGMRII